MTLLRKTSGLIALALIVQACGGGGIECNCVGFDGSTVKVNLGDFSGTDLECFTLPENFPDRGYQRCSEDNARSIVAPYGAEVPDNRSFARRLGWDDLIDLNLARG